MKYYYTDPLAAAYMAKHFGIKLVHYATQEHADEYGCEVGEQWDWKESCSGDGAMQVQAVEEALQYLEDAAPEKIYIHPDSLHMLEPQVGDVIQFNYPEPDDFQTLMVVKNGNSAAVYEQGIEIRYLDDIEYRIIQRNGIAFMWPESE